LFHGLPSDRIRAITQGADGMMWFGTEAGLAKFDGRRTQTLVDAQFPQGRVLSLHTDSNGWLWVGTDSGAARIIGSRVEAIPNLKDLTINAIIEPEKGRLIMATEQGMIYECLVKSDGGFEVKQLLAQALESADPETPGLLPLTSLTVAHDQLLAGSLSRGLLAIEDGSAKEMQARRSAFFIRSLETDARGQLWIGTKGRKNEPALRSAEGAEAVDEEDTVTGTVLTLQAGRNDDMWVGTEGNGAFYFPGTRKVTRFTFDGTAGGLRSNTIFAIFIDREDVVWFGTDRGVSRYDPNAPRVETIGDSADSNFVRTLYQTSHGHTLAGTNRGLFVYDAKSLRWNSVNELSRNIIYSISEDKSGRLLVGSASGFYVGPRLSAGSSIESFSFARLEAGSGSADAIGSIRDIALFRGSTYIASYGRGVERFEDNRVVGVWPADGSVPLDVISLHADGDQRLLVGTGKDGVFSFDGLQATRDDRFESLNKSTVRSFDSTEDKTLWVATHEGVYFCKPEKECEPAAPGYEARSLSNVFAKNGNEVWCATTGSGLLKITLDEQLGPIVSQLDAEQGLPSQNVFASLPQKSGDISSLLIGTSRGIARYTPASMPPTLYATRVISKRVHSPNELQTGLYLEYPQNSLLLDVAAVSSRTFPEKFQYAFTLTDDNGRVIKQKVSRESQFPMEGLSAGNYRVTARAFSKDLVASEPMTFGLSVARAPFPWTSTALAILLALALLALLWAILERRRIVLTSAALVDANRELADARLNLANEAERERRRIARDLHDQTLADLRHLLLMSDQLPSNGDAANKEQLDPAILRKEIESISQEVRRICEDLSPSVLQNVGFAAALEFALAHAIQDAPPDKRFSYEFVCEESLEERVQFPPNVQMQIYRIVQEAVNNICRHAAATHVKMAVSASPDGDFLLQISDDGRHFDHDAQTSTGRGLANMRARASLIGAEISWNRVPNGGTLFSLKLKSAAEEVRKD
jgi:signal transduction histidine kinase/ligand-binding sensor domain-containing protein